MPLVFVYHLCYSIIVERCDSVLPNWSPSLRRQHCAEVDYGRVDDARPLFHVGQVVLVHDGVLVDNLECTAGQLLVIVVYAVNIVDLSA